MIELLTHKTLAPLLLRLALAAIFIVHGLDKVSYRHSFGLSWDESKTLHEAMQVPVAYGELLGGLALVFGFFTRLAALGLAIIMAGAIAVVHPPNRWPLSEGFEYDFALLVMCLAVVLLGGGVLSLDRLIFRRRRPAAVPQGYAASGPLLGKPVGAPPRRAR